MREINIKDVAKKAGVSPSTVSRTISGKVYVNPETKEKVMKAIGELQYYPSYIGKSLKNQRSYMIGIVIPDIRNLIYPIMVRGMEDKARELNYITCMFNAGESEENEKKIFDMLMSMRVDGVVIATGGTNGWKYWSYDEKNEERKQNIVYLLRTSSLNQDCILADNEGGIRQAVEYLLKTGRKNIVLCKGPDNILPYKERFDAFYKIMNEKGIYREEFIVNVDPLGTGEDILDSSNRKDAYHILKEYLKQHPEADAIICSTDLIAIQCIRAAKECNRVIPDDLAIIGFDNVDVSSMVYPPLTTVAQPLYEMGQRAVERLIEKIEGREDLDKMSVRYPTRLIVRETT